MLIIRNEHKNIKNTNEHVNNANRQTDLNNEDVHVLTCIEIKVCIYFQ